MTKPVPKPTRASKPDRGAVPRHTRVIAVANQKGGVGKSTTAVSLGAALAELGYRVLVVDLDPQGNASTGLGIRHERREITVYDVLAAEAPIEGAVVPTPVEGLFAIPSTIDLAGAEIELVSQFSRELRLRRALEPLKEGAYDFIFLDCPPSLGLLTVNALAAADELLVPIQCEYYALEGLGQLLRNVRLVQQNVNPGLHLTGIVMTMHDPRTKLSEQVVEEVRRFFGERVYATVIPRTVRLSEAPGFGQPITVYDPKSRGAECYRELAREVAARLPTEEGIPTFEHIPATPVPSPEPEPMQAPRPLRSERRDGPEPEVAQEQASALPQEREPESEPQVEREVEPVASVAEAADGEAPAAGGQTQAEAEDHLTVQPPESPAVREERGTGAISTGLAREVEPEREPPLDRRARAAGVGGRPAGPQRSAPEAEVEAGTGAGEPSEAERPTPSPGAGLEGASAAPDADGTEAWIAELEAEARAEAEGAVEPEVPPPTPVPEIDLEPEAEREPAVETGTVVRIVDRDAAGEHETEGAGAEPPGRPGKRRWSLFRRGGGR